VSTGSSKLAVLNPADVARAFGAHGRKGKEMAEYSQEDADEVFRHVHATLKAAIDFLIEMKAANPESAKRFSHLDRGVAELYASISELWLDYDADEEEEKEQEHEDTGRAEIGKRMKEDTEAEVDEENEQNERLWEEYRADYKLPAGWPLDYPK
jgi:hypothetical protein